MKEEIIEKDGKKYKVIEIVEEDKELFWGKYTIENIEEAKKDGNWFIRCEAYRILGYTEEAKKDRNWEIRKDAELFFKIKKAREKIKREE